MKKLIVFILILCCIASTAFVKVETNPLFSLSGVEKVCFISSQKYESVDLECVENGDKFFNFCTLENAKENLSEYQKYMDGMQFYLKNSSYEALKNRLKIELVSVQEVDGMKIYCGYTPYVQFNILLNDKKVNIQIAEKADEIVVGFPLILTGY